MMTKFIKLFINNKRRMVEEKNFFSFHFSFCACAAKKEEDIFFYRKNFDIRGDRELAPSSEAIVKLI